MGTFSASLRAIGDAKALSATVQLSDGTLSIVAGEHDIGSWPLSEIRLEQIPTGYRMAAEGEQILLELNDVESFASALEDAGKKRRSLRRKKHRPEQVPPTKSDTPEPPAVTKTVIAAGPARTVALPPSPTPVEQESKPGLVTKIFELIDKVLLKAHKRLGAYLPHWVFSRAMFIIVISLVVLAVFFPGPSSTVLIIAGALMLLFGAMVFSDTMLASKWLPGRATPQQALLTGLGIFLLGVLLAWIAN